MVQTQSRKDDQTLTPHDLADSYVRAFDRLHGKQPRVRYMGSMWYQINGEIVHRNTLLAETQRLYSIAARQRPIEKNIVKRLILKLRGI